MFSFFLREKNFSFAKLGRKCSINFGFFKFLSENISNKFLIRLRFFGSKCKSYLGNRRTDFIEKSNEVSKMVFFGSLISKIMYDISDPIPFSGIKFKFSNWNGQISLNWDLAQILPISRMIIEI